MYRKALSAEPPQYTVGGVEASAPIEQRESGLHRVRKHVAAHAFFLGVIDALLELETRLDPGK